jgi:hypothetical protein
MARRILYCHCAYAKVVPAEVKDQVLARLGAGQRDFDAVPDLCEMSARKDEALAAYADDPELDIVACFPRAVRWLFHGANQTLHAEARVHNMRAESAEGLAVALGLDPNSEVQP